MRVAYRRQHPSNEDGQVPDFLMSALAADGWERTGFDVDFPVLFSDPDAAAAMGYKGRNFGADSIDIVRWYNRKTKVTTGSVMFSEECEGPPGNVHGGAVATALDDILGTMMWRNAGFSRAGIPTLELKVTYTNPVPLRRQLRFDSEVVKLEGRKIFGKVSLREPGDTGKPLAEAKGLFILKKGLPCTIPYEEALQRFGKSNPRASRNLVEFYHDRAAATSPAKL